MSRERTEPGGSTGRPLPARLDPRAGRSAREPGTAGEPEDLARRTPLAVVLTRVVAGLVSVVLLATGGWGWYLGRVAEATVNRTDAIPDGGGSRSGASAAVNVLLVGNDSRADLTDAQRAELNTGVDSGTNTDTMILLHVPADGSRASFVSFPRDSYVDIPGHGRDKLNAAYAHGYADAGEDASEAEKQASGAQLLIRTLDQLSGLRIDHYVEVDLLGFFQLTSVVGGVTVNLCSAVDDSAFSGAVFPAGEQTISGVDALRFVRQRHGTRPDGSPALPRGDLDRIVRQQVFIGGVLRKMLSQEVLLDAGKQRELVRAASESLTVDRGLDLFDLAQQVQSVTPGTIRFQTVPVADPDGRDDQGHSIVRLADEDTLHAFFAHLSDEPDAAAPATVAPSDVSVAVYNGSGVAGLAARAKGSLEAAGFTVTSTGNADRSDLQRTTVRHAPGDEALAATVAAHVPGAATEVAGDATRGTVQLVLGRDSAGIGRDSSPTTTAAPAPAAGGPEPARTAADTSCIN